MKPIASSITGMVAGIQRPSAQDGTGPSEHGYGNRPIKSYALDRQWDPPAAPVPVKPRRSLLQTSPFSTLSPLPELRLATVGRDREGERVTGMLLARSADLPALKSLIAEIHEELKPAEPEEIAGVLGRLLSHYPQQQSGNAMTVAEDWIEDMGQVSAKAFRAAALNWRRSPNAFKPSPGQLLEKVEQLEEPLRAQLALACEVEAREEAMTTHERIGHLHQWLYEVELGFVPFEVEREGSAAWQEYVATETARLKAEIARLEAGEN